MVTTRKAIPTEYNGVRFDSKSEAVFARLLDILGVSWASLHPIRHQGHDWDFLIYIKGYQSYIFGDDPVAENCSYRKKFDTDVPVLIELKPSRPTEAYLDRLCSTYRDDRIFRTVVFGNPWESESYNCIFLPNRDCSPIQISLGISFRSLSPDLIKEAKSYRFDLKSNGRW